MLSSLFDIHYMSLMRQTMTELTLLLVCGTYLPSFRQVQNRRHCFSSCSKTGRNVIHIKQHS
jgi:hypothetical protein